MLQSTRPMVAMDLTRAVPADAVGNDTPGLATGVVEGDIGKGRVLGAEDQGAIALSQAFDRQLAMQDGDDDIVGLGRDGAVDNEKVAVENPGIAHGFALRADEKGRRWATDQMQIQIELALDVVVGGAWETGRHPGAVERQGEFGEG